jgi:hypothetical protein
MSARAFLLGTAASVLVSIGAAMAQTGSMTTGGSGTAGGTAGGTGTGIVTDAAPTQLLPQDGVGTGEIPRSLSGLPQQGGGNILEAAASPARDAGDGAGPIATTPTPMNAPSVLSGETGTAVLTPTPLNARGVGSTAVPPLLGTSVPPLSGDTGPGAAPEEPAGNRLQPQQLIREGFVRFDGQILSVREASRLQQQLLSQQQNEAASGAQVIVLSGSVFQGTTDSPNVVVVPTRRGAAGQARGLTARSLSRGQPVLQGTVEAPRVIALAASPGTVLVVQGSQFGSVEAGTGAGPIRAQIVELPAE